MGERRARLRMRTEVEIRLDELGFHEQPAAIGIGHGVDARVEQRRVDRVEHLPGERERAPGCGIALTDDSTISSLHARVAPAKKGVTIEDLGSTNGTLVNGKRVSGATVAKKGAQIQCGNAIFEVVT